MEGVRRQLAGAEERSRAAEEAVKALRQRAELYEALLAAQSDLNEGLAIVDLDEWRLLHVNDALARMVGYEVDELLGLEDPRQLVPEEDAERLEDARRKHMHGTLGEVERTRGTIVRADGSRLTAEASLAPFSVEGTNMLLVIVRDVSERERERSDLRVQAALMEQVDAAVVATGPDGRITHWNRGAERMYGYTAEEALGERGREFLLPQSKQEHAVEVFEDVRNGEPYEGEMVVVCKGGETIPVYARIVPLRGSRGRLAGVVGVMIDLTEQKRATAQLEEAERRYRQLVERVPAVVYASVPDEEGRTTYISPQVEAVVGYSPEEWIEDRELRARLIHPDDRERVLDAKMNCRDGETLALEYRLVARDGSVVWVRDEAVAREDDEGRCHLDGLVIDITDRKLAESQLQYLADHDALTGLVNRRRFVDELALEIRLAAREQRPSAVLVIDVDNFKYVNDSLGHQAGDEVIRTVARLIEGRLRDTDTVARLGGDEFAVLLRHSGADEAAEVGEQLLDTVRGHRYGDGTGGVRITASAGLSEVDTERTAEEMLAAADLAMYDAKHGGRDRLARFSPELQVQIESRRSRADDIRRSLEEDGFLLHCQPVVDLRTGRTTQHELLLRMRGPDGAVVPPADFLPVAERFDLVQAVDRWVAARAIELLASGGVSSERVHVNVSGKTIGDPAFLGKLERELERSPVEPGRLVLEITETAAISNMEEARRFASRVEALGCGLALDDFGSGFGTFYYLKYLPVDYVKIDGDFVRSLATSAIDRQVVRSIVELADVVGARTVAEFAGDERTIALLRAAGVDYAQGYHLGPPLPVEELRELEPAPMR